MGVFPGEHMKPRVRKLLFMLVLGLAAAPLVPLPAGAVPAPATRLLQAAVPGQGSHFVTSAVRAPGAFDVAGLTYDGPAGADVELRTSRDGRTWSAWADAGDRDAEGPDPASHETARQATPRGTNPIWDDIGYNFLVDRYGTIYEGRYGGLDRPVIGAHAQGFNSTSFGTALLGTFSSVSPPPAMLHALEQLLAWRLDVAHVDPVGHTTV